MTPEPPREPDSELDDEPDNDDDGACYWCAGEGYDETDDPMWDGFGAIVRCKSCGGSGRARDMTIW